MKISGRSAEENRKFAVELQRRLQHVPGIADLRIQQSEGYPSLQVNVDRMRAKGLGITERDVTNSMVASLAGSSQVAPTFWLNPANGVSYGVVAATPQYRLDSLPSLEALPVTGSNGQSQILGGLATINRVPSPAVVTHYNIQPTLDIYANVQGRDLGAVAHDVQKILDEAASLRPKGAVVSLHGQIDALHEAFSGLSFGLLGAVVLIYLLIVVNFQSHRPVRDHHRPARGPGRDRLDAVPQRYLAVGTGPDRRHPVHGRGHRQLDPYGELLPRTPGRTRRCPQGCPGGRLHPLPSGLHDRPGDDHRHAAAGHLPGTERPLGRAVIGGLILATTATLLFVPVVFSLVHGRQQPTRAVAGEMTHD